MDFQFILPEKTSDLLKSSGDHFFVRQVYHSRQIYENLEVCKSLVHQKDPTYVIEHFDTYYSVIELKDSSSATLTCLMRSFDLLFLTVKQLTDVLMVVLSTSGVVENRTRFLNLTKMTLFLFINIVKRIDAIVASNQQQQQMNNNQKKRGKNQYEALEQYPDWERKRVNFLVKLFNVMDCQLEKLWNPPVVEENFVNMVCDMCYRTIEMIPLRIETSAAIETVFQILGTAIKRYNHALNFPVRILQMLRTVEHVARSLPTGINLLHEEYNLSSVFSKLIDEIVETLSLDGADTAISRNFSTFLTEFAALAPKVLIPHLSLLSEELLNCESHVIRNCILQIMGDAVLGELTSEELSEEMKEARNEFLEELLTHINDISAHVRSKVLHIWQNLKVEDAVPLSFHLRVITGAVERLEDKTATVRKQAVQLIKAFLERNPYSSNLTLDELIKKHEEECQKMERLSEAATEERRKAEELDKHWDKILPDLAPFVKENILEKQKKGISDLLLNQENISTLMQLAKVVTKKNKTTSISNGEDALNVVLEHGWDAYVLLGKKIITRELLFKYLYKHHVTVELNVTKQLLISKTLNYWNQASQQNGANEGCNETTLVEKVHPPSTNAVAVAFVEWFFNKYNKDELQEIDFWKDANLVLRIVTDDATEQTSCENAKDVLSILMQKKIQFGFYFNWNNTGIQDRMDVHGMFLVLTCGTLHIQEACVGVFECLFGLLRDPFVNNNWKIKSTRCLLRNQRNANTR